MNLAAEVDDAKFRAAIMRYVASSSRDARVALADKLADWCQFALKELRGSLGATHDMVAWPKPGHRGNANRNWRLVRWLATRRVMEGRAVKTGGHLTFGRERDSRAKSGSASRTRLWVRDAKTGRIRRESVFGDRRPDLAALSEAERKSRNSSKGYVKALVLAAFKAAKAKGRFETDGGIVAQPVGYDFRDSFEAGVQSVMRYKSELSRAMVPRNDSGLDERVDRAFAGARSAVVAKIEKHLAKKLEQAAKKAFAGR